MLREELLYECSEILSSKGIIVSMVTNGSLITMDRAKKLLHSGVERVQVSLDGASSEAHEKLRKYKNSFSLAINAILNLKEAGFKEISIAFTPTKFNWGEIEEAYRLSMRLGASDFRVQPLMILGRTQVKYDEIIPSPRQYRAIVYKINSAIKMEFQ